MVPLGGCGPLQPPEAVQLSTLDRAPLQRDAVSHRHCVFT